MIILSSKDSFLNCCVLKNLYQLISCTMKTMLVGQEHKVLQPRSLTHLCVTIRWMAPFNPRKIKVWWFLQACSNDDHGWHTRITKLLSSLHVVFTEWFRRHLNQLSKLWIAQDVGTVGKMTATSAWLEQRSWQVWKLRLSCMVKIVVVWASHE